MAGNSTKAALWSREGHFWRTIPDSPHRLAIKKGLARSQHCCFKKQNKPPFSAHSLPGHFLGPGPFGNSVFGFNKILRRLC